MISVEFSSIMNILDEKQMQETIHTKVHRKLMTLYTLHIEWFLVFLACHSNDTEYAVSTIRMNLLHD